MVMKVERNYVHVLLCADSVIVSVEFGTLKVIIIIIIIVIGLRAVDSAHK
jgi:hypothetical protein